LIVLFSIIWSSAFIAGAVALKDYDPFSLLTVRFTLSALVLAPVCCARQMLFAPQVVRSALILGLLNNAVYLGLSFEALRTIRPEVVIVVVSCAPFVTTLMAAALGVETLSLRRLAGIGLGFAGVVVISGIASSQTPDLFGLLLATAGMCAFATGTVLFRRKADVLPVPETNFWQCVAGAVALLPIALVFGRPMTIPSPATFVAIAHLVVVVTVGGMALWLVLIRKSGAATASSYHLLNPFFGAGLGHLVLGEALRATDFAGAALIGLGLLITTRSQIAEEGV
jgi:drug/metabolite transporter (DMT)-like permease